MSNRILLHTPQGEVQEYYRKEGIYTIGSIQESDFVVPVAERNHAQLTITNSGCTVHFYNGSSSPLPFGEKLPLRNYYLQVFPDKESQKPFRSWWIPASLAIALVALVFFFDTPVEKEIEVRLPAVLLGKKLPVEKVLIGPGSRVSTGDLLAIIATDKIERAIDKLAQQRKNTLLELKKAETIVELCRQRHAMAEKALKDAEKAERGYIRAQMQQQFLYIQEKITTANGNLQAQRQQKRREEERKKELLDLLAATRIYSPVKGVVTKIYLKQGQQSNSIVCKVRISE